MAWKADQLQVVLFPPANLDQPGALELWSKATGNQEPDAFQRAGVSPIGGSQASGIFRQFSLTIAGQPGRIDINLNTTDNTQVPGVPPQIDDLKNCLIVGSDVAQRLASSLKLIRVAMVLQLAYHCRSPEEATNIMLKDSGASFPPNSTDIIYQYNLRKLFTKSTIPMNRLQTWAVGVKQLISFTAGTQGGSVGNPSAVVIPFASLKLDYNSASQTDLGAKSVEMIGEISSEISSVAHQYISEA